MKRKRSGCRTFKGIRLFCLIKFGPVQGVRFHFSYVKPKLSDLTAQLEVFRIDAKAGIDHTTLTWMDESDADSDEAQLLLFLFPEVTGSVDVYRLGQKI